jgi:signal transduction histidine kinase
MLLRVSREGRYLDVHIPENFAAFLPMSEASFLGKRVGDLFDAEFAHEHERYVLRAIETGEMQRWQYSSRLEGRRRYLEARFVSSGEDEVVVAVSDVTDRVELEREAVNAIERERSRIGRDLHDGLGQLLTGVKLMLEPVKRQMAGTEGQAKVNVERALELITLAIAQTSELARGLSPMPQEAGFTFANALEDLAKQATKFFNVRCTATHDDVPDRLGNERSINLYRIAQEAVTNAVKHGKASRVDIDCRAANGRLVLSVQDDGIGIADADGRGMGMQIMHYRARALDGELSVSPGPTRGTLVRCVCPLPRG